MAATTIHPKCGKRFPATNTAGHCPVCCESFIGLAAFDMHRVGRPGTPERRCQLQPYEGVGKDGVTKVYGHWQDAQGCWHYGRKISEQEKADLWPAKKEAAPAA